jgi:two-component system OmpR family sensor kinase
VNLGSFTRSAARATFSAYRSLPIRWRLAGGSAVLMFVLLAGFGAVVGVYTSRQIEAQFNSQVNSAVEQLQGELNHKLKFVGRRLLTLNCDKTNVHLGDYASPEHAQIRIFVEGAAYCTQDQLLIKNGKAPTTPLFIDAPDESNGIFTQSGYRVAVRPLVLNEPIHYDASLLYALPLSEVNHTIARVQFILLLCVIGGTLLALAAGLWIARRAMAPIAALTEAAREIERTRDPSGRLPHPEADDEIAELARTLEGMLQSLDAARGETEAMLERQREFVADASHELRTPLTSVLANLELLAEELDGEQADSAQAALRSTRRMRRLVSDLLLLARADAKRSERRRPTDLAEVLTEAAAEIWPVAEDHELSIDAASARVAGIRDELHRLALNLLDNAVRHTPPGTHIRARTETEDGFALLTVEDDGPGLPVELERRAFERFVRGGREGVRGTGLGLSIVKAVAQSHGGTASLERPAGATGTRFVIRIPAAAGSRPDSAEGNGAAGRAGQTSTTTGRTIGRRRKRS